MSAEYYMKPCVRIVRVRIFVCVVLREKLGSRKKTVAFVQKYGFLQVSFSTKEWYMCDVCCPRL